MKPLPSKERLDELFVYDGEGLINRVDRRRGRKAGSESGYSHTSGYVRAYVDGYVYFAHRIIWKMVYGSDPNEIDHVDGNPSNNRIENLRSVTPKENSRNKKMRHDSKCVIQGVAWREDKGKWWARINVDGKKNHLGYFDCILAAVLVRKEAEKEHGYHPNHGRATERAEK